MKLKLLLLGASLALALPAPALTGLTLPQAKRVGKSIAINFSRTDAGRALKAFGVTAGVDIVYVAGKEKSPVTLSVTVATAESGVRSIATAAGLVYRKVGSQYVIAASEDMRQALVPYGVRAMLPVSDGSPVDMASAIQESLPYATVRALGDSLTVVGTPEDVASARDALASLQGKAVGQASATDVILLSKAVPKTIAPLLEKLCPGVKVTPTDGEGPGGVLAIAGPASVLDAAHKMAQRLDVDLPDASTIKVYTLRYSSAPDVVSILKKTFASLDALAGPPPNIPKRAGFNPLTAALSTNSTSTSTQSQTQGLGTTNPSERTTGPDVEGARAKTLILRGRPDVVEQALRLLEQIDRKPKQIMIEVHVVETSPSEDEAKGLTYDWSSFSFYETPRGSTGTGSATRPVGLGQFSRVPWDFNAVLNAKVLKKEAKILARPSIRVIDSGEASVFIGDTLRARIVTGGALGAQNVEIKEFPIGIILLIAPQVNADGNITMHVNPVISTVTSMDAFNVPQTSSREAETTAIVKDGETVVLGGLIRDEDMKTVQEIPFLSKLPVIGELFRNRTRNHRRSDILVSITPHIIDDAPQTTNTGAKP